MTCLTMLIPSGASLREAVREARRLCRTRHLAVELRRREARGPVALFLPRYVDPKVPASRASTLHTDGWMRGLVQGRLECAAMDRRVWRDKEGCRDWLAFARDGRTDALHAPLP